MNRSTRRELNRSTTAFMAKVVHAREVYGKTLSRIRDGEETKIGNMADAFSDSEMVAGMEEAVDTIDNVLSALETIDEGAVAKSGGPCD